MSVEGNLSLEIGITQVVNVYIEASRDLTQWKRYQIGSSALPEADQHPGDYGSIHTFLGEDLPGLEEGNAAFARWSVVPR